MLWRIEKHEITTTAHYAAVLVVCSTCRDTAQRKHGEAVRPVICTRGGVHLWRLQVEKSDGR